MIYLLRHGETEFNVERRLQGSCDSPLTDLGRRQGISMGRALRLLIEREGRPFALTTSPQPRALSTAEIVGTEARLPMPPAVDPRLREVSVGSWEGRTMAEIEEELPGVFTRQSLRQAWADGQSDGEAFESARARVSSWLEEWFGRDVVAISHGITGTLLRAVYLDWPRDRLHAMQAAHATIWRLDRGRIEEIPVG